MIHICRWSWRRVSSTGATEWWGSIIFNSEGSGSGRSWRWFGRIRWRVRKLWGCFILGISRVLWGRWCRRISGFRRVGWVLFIRVVCSWWFRWLGRFKKLFICRRKWARFLISYCLCDIGLFSVFICRLCIY